MITCDENAKFSAQVFKTVADPFVRKLNMIRVFTGSLKSGMTVYNATTGETYPCDKIPPHILELVNCGGLVEQLTQKLKQA